MPYILDGNNLIGRVRRTAKPSAEDRAALVAEIAGRLRQTRAKATIFFDGPAGERTASLGSLSVRVPSGGSADDAIVREIERAKAPGEAVVVTADRGLGEPVPRRGREGVLAGRVLFPVRDVGGGGTRTLPRRSTWTSGCGTSGTSPTATDPGGVLL